jgi:hypothetical protein
VLRRRLRKGVEEVGSLTDKLVTCPICGQRMRRITPTHLKKHDMTLVEFREQFGDIAASDASHNVDMSDPEVMRQLTGEVLNYIATDEGISDVAKRIVQNLMRDHDSKLRIALNLTAMRKLRSMDFLFNKLDDIQKNLLDERRLAGMDGKELSRVYQIVEKSLERITDYLKSLSIDRDKRTGHLFEQTNVVNIFEKDPDAPPAPSSPAGREKIRSLVNGLIHNLRQSPVAEVKSIPSQVARERDDYDDTQEADASRTSPFEDPGPEPAED